MKKIFVLKEQMIPQCLTPKKERVRSFDTRYHCSASYLMQDYAHSTPITLTFTIMQGKYCEEFNHLKTKWTDERIVQANKILEDVNSLNIKENYDDNFALNQAAKEAFQKVKACFL